MDRFKQIDASNSSIGALLFHDEEVVSLQDSIGLYDGKEKTLHQNNGTVYLTSHRLLYIDDLEPHRYSCSLELSLVKQSEYYAGFLKSSPKITLTLAQPDGDSEPSRLQRRPTPGTPLRKSVDVDALSLRASTAPSRSSTPASISLPPPTDSVKLSFRKGGDKAFYNLLKSTLKSRSWASNTKSNGASSSDSRAVRVAAGMVDLDGRSAALKRVGIDGILSSVDSTSRAQNDDMHGALKDLEALMRKAKQMVEFAEALNAKLTKQEQAAAAAREAGLPDAAPLPDQEAATLIRSSLVQLGLPAPAITEDMARDQDEYHRELARELAGLLLGTGGRAAGLMGAGKIAAKGKSSDTLPRISDDELKGRGLVGLDEVWCVWNRARGVALVPPQALRSAAAFLPDITSPSVRIKTFRSGLSVLHTPRYSDDAFASRILHFLDTLEWEHKMKRIEQAQSLRISDGRGNTGVAEPSAKPEEASYGDNLSPWGAGASILEIAEKEDVPILLINEMMDMIESKTGMVVRDEGGPNGTRWFVNHFSRV
uniref:Vacuolar protein-sorting-associated protein 36 n=1 Tax=Kalmanozyma brasiliensis (strain GHG001) TaxID=1365824 RepID=V5EQS9_KALBG